MNALGFFAVIILCITAIFIAIIYVYNEAIMYKIIYKNRKDLEKLPIGFTNEEQEKKINEEIDEQKLKQASMDAVIQSVNELMGIKTTEEEDKDGR